MERWNVGAHPCLNKSRMEEHRELNHFFSCYSDLILSCLIVMMFTYKIIHADSKSIVYSRMTRMNESLSLCRTLINNEVQTNTDILSHLLPSIDIDSIKSFFYWTFRRITISMHQNRHKRARYWIHFQPKQKMCIIIEDANQRK